MLLSRLSKELLLIDADPAEEEVGDVSRVSASVLSSGPLQLSLLSFEVVLVVVEMVGTSTP